MNKVLLIGRMTKDAELRMTQSGKNVTTFGIAVDDGFGENKQTYFFNVTVWGKSAEAVANYTHKGSKVAVSGKLTSRSYEDRNGNKRTAIEVVADALGGVEFLENKNQSNNGTHSSVISDEEIPF